MLSVIFWKKVWTWIKHYWYWPVIIILLIFSMVSSKGLKEKLFGLLMKSKENYEKEIKVIKEVNEQKDVKKEQAAEEHVEEIRKIEEEHDIKVEELEIEKQKELAETIEKNKDRPEKLAEDIAKILSSEFLKKR